MLHNLKQEIEAWLGENISNPALFVVEVAVKFRGSEVGHIVVLLDSDNGITIDDCSALSRKLSEWLELHPSLNATYQLEVSSPGVDYPLSSQRQFTKNVGRNLQLLLNTDITVTGKLEQVTETELVLEVTTKQKGKKAITEMTTVPFNHIKKANVLVSFK